MVTRPDTALDAPPRFHAPAAPRRRFYRVTTLALCVVVFAGFAPSFYLRPLFDRPPIPSALIIVHGLVFTTWMALLFVQSNLVAAGRVHLHRTLGVAGGCLAALLVTSGTLVQFASIRGAVVSGAYDANLPFMSTVLVSGFLGMAVFGVLVASALYFRRNPETHKRIMVIATLALVPAAIVRLPGAGMLGPFAPFAADLFLILLVLNDLHTRGRPHAATLLGGSVLVASHTVTLTPLIMSDAVMRLARWIGS